MIVERWLAAIARRPAPSPWLALGFFLLLSLVLNFAYLGGGFQCDDLIFLNMMRAEPHPYSRWGGFWSISPEQYAGFRNLWWFEDGTRAAFLRPLPSLLIEGSVRLFSERAFPLHLLSVLLHGGVAYAIYRFFCRAGAAGGGWGVPFLAALIFAGCEDHSMGIGWIATITDLLCVQFILLAFLGHLRWRKSRRPADLARALVPLGLAFGSKESAAVAPLVLVLLELMAPVEAGGTARWRSFLRAWWRWAPAAGALAAYLAIYRASGIGDMRNLMYIDPLSQPVAYLGHLALHLPVMILAAVTPVPPSTATFMPGALLPMAAAGLALLVLLAAGLRPLGRRAPLVAWSFAAFVIALLPQLGTDASERLLYFPMVPASYCFASLLATIGPGAGGALLPRLTRAWGWGVLAGVLAPGLVLSAAMPPSYGRSFARPSRDLATSFDLVRERAPAAVVLVNTSGAFLTFYPPAIYEHHLGRPLDTYVLSSLWGRMTLERLDGRSFVLRTDRPGWLSNLFARVARHTEALEPGRRHENGLFAATLLELTPDRRDALAVRFDFAGGLDDRSILFLSWNGVRFVPLAMDAIPLATPVPLADTSDVWRSMM